MASGDKTNLIGLLESNTSIVFAMVDSETGRFSNASRGCESNLGYSVSELVGRNYFDIFSSESVDKV